MLQDEVKGAIETVHGSLALHKSLIFLLTWFSELKIDTDVIRATGGAAVCSISNREKSAICWQGFSVHISIATKFAAVMAIITRICFTAKNPELQGQNCKRA